MKANNASDAFGGPNANIPVMTAVPAEEGNLIVAESAESPDAVCRDVVGIAGWVSLLANAFNMVSMSVACYLLHQYLIAPHPDNDSYGLAGLAYLIFVPSMLDSILMALLLGFVLWGEYSRPRRCDVAGEDTAPVPKARGCCLVVVCVLLLLLSLWPTCVGLAILLPQVAFISWFRLSASGFATAIWVAVTISFATFTIALFKRVRACRVG